MAAYQRVPSGTNWTVHFFLTAGLFKFLECAVAAAGFGKQRSLIEFRLDELSCLNWPFMDPGVLCSGFRLAVFYPNLIGSY